MFSVKEKAASYSAAMVRGWMSMMGEDGAALREFLKCKDDGTLSTKAVSKRLMAHVDEPTVVGGESWTLKSCWRHSRKGEVFSDK